MRFFTDDDTPTRVRWYFTDKPPLPFVHRFGSHNWLSEGEATEEPLGEVIGANRRWYRGDKVGSAPGDHVCGTEQQWISGQKLPPNPPIALTPDGTPICCFGNDAHEDEVEQWTKGVRFSAALSINPNYDAEIELLRYWQIAEQPTFFQLAPWNHERQWEVELSITVDYTTTWGMRRKSTASESADIEIAPQWGHERSENGNDIFGPASDATWAIERLEESTIVYGPDVDADWDIERSHTHTFDWTPVVTTFDCGTIVAAGSTQGTATAIANDSVLATSTGANQGIILPAGCYRIIVKNNNGGGGNAIFVYPPSGAKIAALATDAPQTILAGNSLMFVEMSSTEWRTINVS